MSRFLLWSKCDWCGKWVLFKIAWQKKDDKDYCNEACLEHKTQVLDLHGRKE